jgi:hypothetical protein
VNTKSRVHRPAFLSLLVALACRYSLCAALLQSSAKAPSIADLAVEIIEEYNRQMKVAA